MAKYDVGIVGCWYWGNYGSLLNGYATFSLLKNMGLKPLNIVTPNNGFEPHAKKFFEAVYEDSELSECLPFERVNEYNDMCDSFLTGSDQIWHNDPNKKDRRYDYFFHLGFTRDEKKRISFSTSFGNLIQEKDEYYAQIRKLLNRYDAISLREKSAIDYLKKNYGINATHVLEPVLIAPKKLWEDLAEKSKLNFNENYIFSYILDPTAEKRKLIKSFSEKTELKSINALDGFSANYEVNKAKLNLENTLPNIWAADLLKGFKEAEYVITDSFHGMCFALIFNKPFIVVANYGRGIERFKSILGMCGLENRLIDIKDIDNLSYADFLERVDYGYVNSVIDKNASEGKKWLEDNVKRPKNEFANRKGKASVSINDVLSYDKCVGCGACVSECPVGVIELKGDEDGIYRSYVLEDNCIKCGKCIDVCPALARPKNFNSNEPVAYAFIHKNLNTVKESSSGGAFTALAETVLERGGTVVGAAWKSDFRVEHIIIDNKADLYKLQKSKYFQSYMGDIYKTIKEKLNNGTKVLFTGTPCQVVGLKKYLKIPYSNLILVDLLCANCPSADIFNKYIIEKNASGNIKNYNFRYKKDTNSVWDAKSILLEMKDGSKVVESIDSDSYLKVYHTCSLGLSSQCMQCKYQGNRRYGDITIGDCWGIDRFDSTVEHKYGVSAIIVNNEKGQELVNNIDNDKINTLKEISLEDVKKYNVLAFLDKRDWESSLRREHFIHDVKKMEFSSAAKNALSLKVSGLEKFEVESMNKKDIVFSWSVKDNIHYSGLIIEELIDANWIRVARVGNEKVRSYKIENKKEQFGHDFRAKTFYFDGSAVLYSDYITLKILIQ